MTESVIRFINQTVKIRLTEVSAFTQAFLDYISVGNK